MVALTLSHFKKLFHTSHSSSLAQHKGASSLEYAVILTNLGNILIEEEIRSAIFSFKPYKAPGPDGLHPFFY